MKKIIYKIQYWIMIVAIKILCLFSENARFKFGDFLGLIAYKLVKKRRITALLNLRMAFPEKSEKELENIALESFKVMIKGFLCTTWLKEYLSNPNNFKIINQELFLDTYNQGRGLITTLLHMGNIEASLKIANNLPVIVVAKKQRNPYINSYIENSRKNDLNLIVYTKGASTGKDLIERMNNKEILGLFHDHRDKGATVNFFNTETVAPTGVIFLALKFDTPLLFVYNYFNKDNSCTIVCEKFDLVKTGSFKKDVLTNVQRLIDRTEDVIREHPEQWMWFHDRWKLYSKLYKHKKKSTT